MRDILESQFAQRRILLQPEALEYLYTINFSTIRGVLSVTNAIANTIALDGQPMTLSKVREILHELKVTVPSDSEQLVARFMEKMNIIVPIEQLQKTRPSKEIRIMRENIILELLKNDNIRQADLARVFKLTPQYISKAVSRHNK
jgi:chromosomal replication initiation ATPase DnaA